MTSRNFEMRPGVLVNNILSVYEKSTHSERIQGSSWYRKANRICRSYANQFKLPLDRVTATLAVLSPNNTWEGNVNDLFTTLYAHWDGDLRRATRLYKPSPTYMPLGDGSAYKHLREKTYPANLAKAFDILQHGNFSALRGAKVNAFHRCVLNPDNDVEEVCIDSHATSIAHGVRYTSKGAPPLTSKRYSALSDAYKEAGALAGLLPHHMQAITWVSWRNLISGGGQ